LQLGVCNANGEWVLREARNAQSQANEEPTKCDEVPTCQQSGDETAAPAGSGGIREALQAVAHAILRAGSAERSHAAGKVSGDERSPFASAASATLGQALIEKARLVVDRVRIDAQAASGPSLASRRASRSLASSMRREQQRSGSGAPQLASMAAEQQQQLSSPLGHLAAVAEATEVAETGMRSAVATIARSTAESPTAAPSSADLASSADSSEPPLHTAFAECGAADLHDMLVALRVEDANARQGLALLQREQASELADVFKYNLVDELLRALDGSPPMQPLTRIQQGKLRERLSEWQQQHAPMSERLVGALEGFAGQVGRVHSAFTGATGAVRGVARDATSAIRAVTGRGAHDSDDQGNVES